MPNVTMNVENTPEFKRSFSGEGQESLIACDEEVAESASLYVHYGCHFIAPKEWLNFDASPTLRFERLPIIGKLYTKNEARFPENVRYGDIVKGIPLPDGSCSGVYASHVLEHLSFQDFHKAISNTFRLLQSGGIFRLVVPDLEVFARSYLDGLASGCADANCTFLRKTYLGCETRPTGILKFLSVWLGNSRHLWMWDYPSLRNALTEHGFVKIRRCKFNDCDDAHFSHVERERRLVNSVAIEATK